MLPHSFHSITLNLIKEQPALLKLTFEYPSNKSLDESQMTHYTREETY